MIEQNFMLNYNSLVMKKSIINDEFTVICEENFLVTIGEGIVCGNGTNNSQIIENGSSCLWQTTFNVYELPLLK